MSLDEFEFQSRDVIEQTLNHLQAVNLMLTDLEGTVLEAGQSVQMLGQLIETFVIEQRQQQTTSE